MSDRRASACRVLTLLGFCVLIAGCGESDSSYFARLDTYREPRNALREQRSIPIIPANWVARADRTVVAWENPDFIAHASFSMHAYKFLNFANYDDKGTITEETDDYESGRSWVDPDAGTLREHLRITYSFDLERQHQPPWTAEVLELNSQKRELSLAKALQILKKWGIDPLQFNQNKRPPVS
jgi:hypothetical protein